MYWVTGALGVAFAAAPFVLGYSATDSIGSWCVTLVGIAVVLISVKWAASRDKMAAGFEVLAVSWFSLIAPLEIGFVNGSQAKLTGLVMGGLLVLLVSVYMVLRYQNPEPARHDARTTGSGKPHPVR